MNSTMNSQTQALLKTHFKMNSKMNSQTQALLKTHFKMNSKMNSQTQALLKTHFKMNSKMNSQTQALLKTHFKMNSKMNSQTQNNYFTFSNVYLALPLLNLVNLPTCGFKKRHPKGMVSFRDRKSNPQERLSFFNTKEVGKLK